MSILIKGMEMPKHDGVYLATIDIDKDAYAMIIIPDIGSFNLIEVPEPHGRLIDADKMVQYLHHQECDSCKTPNSDECFACKEPYAEAVADLQPTVIKAEE